MAGTLASGSSVPGSSPGREHRIVFLGKTRYCHNSFLRPGVKMGTSELTAGGNASTDQHSFQGGVEVLLLSLHAIETGDIKR